ncbi:hypothetical protein DER46DRAFT_573430 [Fusarium sp. MPI-SDFR-AT-0072]|nr:hypothetical protein DER46DRAFT_573430 [Fusarium sp. MPI-SDFR-AT-0072]
MSEEAHQGQLIQLVRHDDWHKNQACDHQKLTTHLCSVTTGDPSAGHAKSDEQKGGLGEVEIQENEFAGKIPGSVLSPAEVMSYLLSYRSCPADAVKDCDHWVDSLVQSKKHARD